MALERTNRFSEVLDKLESKIKSMAERLREARLFFENGKLDEAFECSLKLEAVAEQATLLTRALPAYTGNPKAEQFVEKLIRDAIRVEIGYTAEGWFSIRIPMLLPKKEKGSADYIRSFLYPSMRDFFLERTPVRYRNCVLIYRHVYDRARPERQKRDHDNIEINMVSDIVAMYVMPDDGPEICSHYYCSAEGTEDRTEIYVVPKPEFQEWLSAERGISEEGVKLYEKRPEIAKKHM